MHKITSFVDYNHRSKRFDINVMYHPKDVIFRTNQSKCNQIPQSFEPNELKNVVKNFGD